MKETNSIPKQVAVLVVTCALVIATLSIAPLGAVAQDGGTNTQSPTEINSCTVIGQPGRYVLTADITTGTADPCIEIMASDVFFDGAGHTIDGVGTDTADGYFPSIPGISVGEYFSTHVENVTVTDVIVTDWEIGIRYKYADGGRILDTTVRSNRRGIVLNIASNNTLAGNDVSANNGTGIFLGDATGNNTLRDNTVNANAGSGIRAYSTATVAGTFTAAMFDSTLVNNTVRSNGGSGISLTFSGSNVLRGNHVIDNAGDGVTITGSSEVFPDESPIGNRNTLVDNVVRSNGGTGISISASSGNTLRGNVVQDNGANGIALHDVMDRSVIARDYNYTRNNTLVRNHIEGNGANGVLLDDANGSEITGNVIVDSGAAGIKLAHGATDNLLYDNRLSNDNNVEFATDFTGTQNTWNVSKRPVKNIVGGPTTGGNYYAKPSGAKGYSEQCTDANGDGFCDQPYDLGGGGAANTDYLPLAVGPASAAPTEIDSCTVINQSGQYVLTADIENANPPGRKACIVITAVDVVLDGEGHTVDGTSSGIGIAARGDTATVKDIVVSDWTNGIIYETSEGSVLNVTIQNNEEGVTFAEFSSGTVRNSTVRNNGAGIKLEVESGSSVVEDNRITSNGIGISIFDSQNNRIVDNAIINNSDDGVAVHGIGGVAGIGFQASGNVLTGNVIADNGDSGIELSGHVNENLYYNNVFNNTDNVNFTAGYVGINNSWNVSKQSGTNIVGGPSIGGNYYTKPGTAEGYSERCTDTDSNGFCDQPYDLGAPNSTDFLPLTQTTTLPSDNGDAPPGEEAPPEQEAPPKGEAPPKDTPLEDEDTPPDDGGAVPVCEAGSTNEVLGENDEDDDGDGAIDEDDEDNDGPSNDDDDGDGAIDEDDECDDGDDGSDEFNGNAEDDDDGDGAVDEDDESDSGNSDDVDNDGDGAIDEDDEPDTDD